MKIGYVLAIALGLSITCDAQLAPGFKDFDVASGLASSTPIYLTEFDGKLYFYGSDGSIGREPHFVQGRNSATLIKNMNGASNNAIGLNYNRPSAGMNGKYYFTANNGSAGEEMFEYDGTNAPKLVFDPTFNADSSSPDNYTVLNNNLYFTATTAADGRELYKHTGSGTPTKVTDVNTGAGDGATGDVVAYNGKIYFAGNDGTDGIELWMYDPVNNMASIAADIESGAGSSSPANFMVISGKLYFTANSFLHGKELYSFDGSTAKRLTDISPQSLSSIVGSSKNTFALFNGKIYFAARDTTGESHIWTYDPSNDDVQLAHKINPNGDSGPREFVVYNNRLIVSVNDGANGFELYAIDNNGTPAIIGDLCQGTNSSLPSELTIIGDELYFSANNCNTSGVDLFSYNHTKVGVRNVLFDADVSIYPNPVQKNLNIEMRLTQREELQVRVADSGGKNIYDTGLLLYDTGKNKMEVPMRNMPPGAYIYYITNKNGTTYLTGKVVKQ